MHVLHSDDLSVEAVIYIISPGSIEAMRAEGKNIVTIEGDERLKPHEIHLFRDGNGAVRARKKDRMGIAGPARAQVGQPLIFSNVPHGASISLDGQQIAVMDDDSAELEIMAEVAGTHRFGFSLTGHMDEEFTVEVDSAT